MSGYRTDPQVLDARGRVPRGKAMLGLSSEVAFDGRTGLVVGLDSRRYIEAGDTSGIDVVGVLPPGGPDDLMLAVAWGVGPDGADVGELGPEHPRSWVPAAGLVRTQTYIPGGA